MMGTANLTLVARLARDPELRTTSNGKSVCSLTLPVDTGFGDNKTTTWWTATLWGKRAEAAANYLRKGAWVSVSGPARIRQYDKRDGSAGFSAEVDASSWEFVGNKSDNEAPAASSSSGRQRHAMSGDMKDLPF